MEMQSKEKKYHFEHSSFDLYSSLHSVVIIPLLCVLSSINFSLTKLLSTHCLLIQAFDCSSNFHYNTNQDTWILKVSYVYSKDLCSYHKKQCLNVGRLITSGIFNIYYYKFLMICINSVWISNSWYIDENNWIQ